MKFLTTKQEQAEAINFGKYPVLKLDICNTYEIGGKICGFVNGSKFKTNPREYKGVKLFDHHELQWFDDSKTFSLSAKSVSIHNREISCYEMITMVEYANAPVVDDKAVIVVYNSKNDTYLTPFIYSFKKREEIDLKKYFSIE